MRKVNFSATKFLLLFIIGSSFAQTGAKYLVIYHEMFNTAIRPLVEWKTKKGIKAVSVSTTQIGSTPAQIKSYIQTAYNTWNPRPEYLLLVGSPDLLPSYDFTGYNDYSDDYYADMTGNYEIELCIGRFHCENPGQCSVVVAKSIGYEKSETMHDSTWFVKGTTIVREDYQPDPYYQADTRYIRNLWLDAGYTSVDSFQNTRGNNQNDVINAINNGRAFVVFRGQSVSYWWDPFDVDPDVTNNGYKLPVVISGTCATLTLSPWENMLGDAFLCAGTVQNPKGAVGFFGTSLVDGHVSQYRGTVAKGFFQALYVDSIFTMGSAAKRAKFIMDSIIPNQSRYMEWNLLGDPELNIWTKTPQELTVTRDTIVFLQPTNYQVWVGCSGEPVHHALVCVMMDSTVYNYGYTDSTGQVTLSFTPQHVGTLQVTVTGHNYFPYEGTATVQSSNEVLISGNIRYYSNQNPVESTRVVLSGGIVDTTLTDSTGFYSFTNLPVLQNYTVSPYKVNSIRQSAVSSYDAALILRHAIGTIILDSLQRIAADVSGNSQITSFDAALVLQYNVGIRYHFPVGAQPSGDTVDWAFRPSNRNYTPLDSNRINQNYTAILYGEVSGNWQPILEPTALNILSDNPISYGGNLPKNEKKIEYGIQDTEYRTQGLSGKTGIIAQPESQTARVSIFSISIPNAKEVVAADAVLTYDPDEIVLKEVTVGTSTSDYLIAWTNGEGIVRVGLAGVRPLNGKVELARVFYQKMRDNASERATPIQIRSIVLNEKETPTITTVSDEGIAGNKTELPMQFSLMSNQPNPFKSHTVIRYALPTVEKVSLLIYDITGKLVKSLVNEYAKPGFYSVNWNATDDRDKKVARGVYLLRAEVLEKSYKENRKLIVVK